MGVNFYKLMKLKINENMIEPLTEEGQMKLITLMI